MAIAANKVPGVRSAAIVDTDTAKLSREHNDLNVLDARRARAAGITRAGDRQDVPRDAASKAAATPRRVVEDSRA